MSFAQFTRISLAFGDREILKEVSINLQAGTKAALTGANGSGKSTLIKVIAGLIEADSGECSVQKGCRIAYLPQSGIVHRGSSLKEEADKAFGRGYALEAERDQIGEALTQHQAKEALLLERYQHITNELESSGWYRREAQAEEVLMGLGFKKEDLIRETDEFSGGWQMRIALAKVLLEKPDILLLDEPTNYLDLEARNWLERFLLDFKGGFLLVSHDRYFLDTTVSEIYELWNGKLRRFSGNYSQYERSRQAEIEELTARYERQQEEIKRIEDFIRRFGAKASKAGQAQDRKKMLERMERIEIPEHIKKIQFRFPPAPHSGRLAVRIEHLRKSYDGIHAVINDVSLTIERGMRLAAVGKNGAGKSTLLRILSGNDTAFEGSMSYGTGVASGYFSQDSAEELTSQASILEFLESEAPLDMIPSLRDMLGAFLFRGDDVYKPVNVLSGGEKSRIAVLRLLLRPLNLLILDEPTNHLDLHSKDVLLDALKSFKGTIVFVSHDRSFIDSLATSVLELSQAGARYFPGDYEYYLRQTEAESEPSPVPASTEAGTARKAWEEDKKAQAQRRKLQREEERLLHEISAHEEAKAALEARLSDPAVYSDGVQSAAVQTEIEAEEALIEKLSSEWERISAELMAEDSVR